MVAQVISSPLLIDHSAWSRLGQSALPRDRADAVFERMEAGELVVCLPFLLEAGYSARAADEHAALISRLQKQPRATVDEHAEERAICAQGQLARVGHHRLAPPDLIIAALADRDGLGILHYDADYDVIRERTGLDFESVWLAPRGTL